MNRSPASAGKCHDVQDDVHFDWDDIVMMMGIIVNLNRDDQCDQKFNSTFQYILPLSGSSVGLSIYLHLTWPTSQRGGPGSR